MIGFQSIVSGWVSLCAELASAHRDVAVNDQQLLSGDVELATEFIWFPVYYSESFVVWVKNGLQKLQFGLQPRNRHLLLISNHQAAGWGEVGAGCGRAVESGLRISHISVRTTTQGWRVRSSVNTVTGIWQYWQCSTQILNHLIVFYFICGFVIFLLFHEIRPQQPPKATWPVRVGCCGGYFIYCHLFDHNKNNIYSVF